MLVNVSAFLRLTGETFSPHAVESQTGLRFSEARERGAIADTGRYIGQAVPCGSAEYASPDSVELLGHPDLGSFCSNAEALLKAARSCGADDAVLHVDVAYRDQCNFELSPLFVAAVQRLGIPLTMTCYESDAPVDAPSAAGR